MKRYVQILLILVIIAPCAAFAQEGESVEYKVGDQTYEGYYVDAGEQVPMILMIHDWDGLTDYEVKRAGMLADLGYSVFAADLFGAGVRPTEIDERRRLTGALYQDREKMRRLLFGALKAAEDQGANVESAVAMGYCFGGTAVLELARAGADLKAFVPFHGGLDTPEGQDYSQTTGTVLVFHGSADKMVSMDDLASLGKELEDAGIAHEMVTYGGARHAFSVFGSDRYNETADHASWNRFVQFLKGVFDKE